MLAHFLPPVYVCGMNQIVEDILKVRVHYKKDYNVALDRTLKHLITVKNKTEEKDKNLPFTNKKLIDTLLELEKEFDLEKYEIELIWKKLIKDEYIDLEYKITLNGIDFLNNGGYRQKQKNDKIELKYKDWTTYALIFGGAVTGCYYTAKGLLWLYGVLPHCH